MSFESSFITEIEKIANLRSMLTRGLIGGLGGLGIENWAGSQGFHEGHQAGDEAGWGRGAASGYAHGAADTHGNVMEAIQSDAADQANKLDATRYESENNPDEKWRNLSKQVLEESLTPEMRGRLDGYKGLINQLSGASPGNPPSYEAGSPAEGPGLKAGPGTAIGALLGAASGRNVRKRRRGWFR